MFKNKLLFVLSYLIPFVVLSASIEFLYVSSFSYLHIINKVLLVIVFMLSYFIIESKYEIKNIFIYLLGTLLIISLSARFSDLASNKLGSSIYHREYTGLLLILTIVFIAANTKSLIHNKN